MLFFCITVNSSARYYKSHGYFSSDATDSIPKKIADSSSIKTLDSIPKKVLRFIPEKNTDSVPATNIPIKKDTAIVPDYGMTDTLPFHSDSASQEIDTTHVRISKDSLDGPITYSAADSVVLDVPTKNITLYNKATTKYKDVDLEAYNIRMDQSNNLLVATYTMDTSGTMIGRPKMTQADSKMESDSMVFDMKTQKGITINSFTQSGEMYVMGEKMKKITKDDYFAWHGRFTTCDLDTPHFAFRTNKMKLINKKMAITGPVHPEFEGVPIPIYIPFGYFPISQGRHSGFLAPTLDVSSQYGLGLDGIGYYRVVSDNFDVAMRANLYSYGGYNLYFDPEYRVRYHYSGRIGFTYQYTKVLSNEGVDPYIVNTTYQLTWAHMVDSKAHPGQNFSASVNLMSAKFNNYNITNPTAVYNNSINSSIAFSKTFDDGKYNLTVNGNHNQNNLSGLVNINAPSIGFTAITVYPFAPKDLIGTPKWYEKLGIGLSSNISGLTSFYDSLFSFKHLLDTFQYGAQNNIPISLALPHLGFLQITPGISFQNRILSTAYDYSWDTSRKKIDTTSQRGVFYANSVGFSLGLSTALYGTFQGFGKDSKIMGIRHTVRPTISINYTPDLASGYYKNIQVDSLGDYQNLNRFAGNIYSTFSPGTFGGLSFGIDNNIEMKVRSKTDTSAGANEKVKLVDGFGFTSAYNFLADSFKLQPFNLYFRSTLFKKINLSATGIINPYQRNAQGFNVDRYAWEGGGFNIGKFTNATVSLSSSFKSKPIDPKKDEDDKKMLEEGQSPMTIDEQQQQLDYIRANPGQFVDFNISWTLNVSFAFSYQNSFVVNQYVNTVNSSLILNGDFNLTEKWKMGFNCYYDVKHLQMENLSTFISRDMHCWQLTINVVPVGYYRSFNITINPKSNILRDLKINRSRTFY